MRPTPRDEDSGVEENKRIQPNKIKNHTKQCVKLNQRNVRYFPIPYMAT